MSTRGGTATRYTFQELESKYNFPHTSERVPLFTDMIVEQIEACKGPPRVLDIGCGEGIGQDMAATKRVGDLCASLGGELWGLEPDPKISAPPGVHVHQHATMETAKLPENSFDVAYSAMVMEHVPDPKRFLEAVHRCLKPGGVYLFLTVNGDHYFARIASTLRRLGIDDLVLTVVRGRAAVEDYHYPIAYKCNRPSDITACCASAGFEPPRFVFVERGGVLPYLPGPTAILSHAFNAKRRLIKNPRALLEVICMTRKP